MRKIPVVDRRITKAEKQLNIALAVTIAVAIPILIKAVVTAREPETNYFICNVTETVNAEDYTDLVVELPNGSLHVYSVDDVDFEVSEVCLKGNLNDSPKTYEVVALR